ncbi:MAG: hypothetical protein K2H28_02505 [Ruminococcus sp.]|nr:hypothetical protein [Ruminococcus sp.]
MGFLGFAFILIFISILINLMIVFAGIFLIAGFILYKTHQTIAIILFVLAGLNFIGFTAFKIYERFGKQPVSTSQGKVYIESSVREKYKKYVRNMDIEKVNEMLEKYPALVYYKIRENKEECTLLFYGLYHCNVDMMKCALKHGEQFKDRELDIDRDFLWNFFSHVNGDTTTEMIDTIRFTIEYDAEVVHCFYYNLYDEAKKWVQKDGVISPEDEKLLNLIEKYGG